MRKFFGILLVFGLVALPAISQDSAPTSVPVSANFSAGVILTLNGGSPAASWAGIPLPDVPGEFVVSDEGSQDCYIAWRLPDLHSIDLVCETTVDLEGSVATLNMGAYMKHVWSGDIIYDAMLPAVGFIVSIYTDALTNGFVNATFQYEMANKIIRADTYVGEVVYTVIDTV